MAVELTTVQVTVETRDALKKLANQDRRSMAAEFETLVMEEHARRFSTPQPLITIAEAVKASE